MKRRRSLKEAGDREDGQVFVKRMDSKRTLPSQVSNGSDTKTYSSERKARAIVQNYREPRAQEVALSRLFCLVFYQRLPIELRDAVYQYISTAQSVDVTERPRTGSWAPYFCEFPATARDYHGFRQHWNIEYVGEDIKRELVENWYRSSSFRLEGPRSWVRRFLTQDRWNMGMDPRLLISKVSVDVDLNPKRKMTDSVPSDGSDVDDEPRWSPGVLNILSSLLLFKQTTCITVYLWFKIEDMEDTLQQISILSPALKFVSPSLNALKDAGHHRTKIILNRRCVIELGTTGCSSEDWIHKCIEGEKERIAKLQVQRLKWKQELLEDDDLEPTPEETPAISDADADDHGAVAFWLS